MAKQEEHSPHRNEQRESPNKQQQLERTSGTFAPVRRGAGYGVGPFSLMQKFSADMDRLFGDFFGSSPRRRDLDWPAYAGAETFWPELEVRHVGDKLLVNLDVPGLKKDDVHVEVQDGELCISGERRSEAERKEGRYYRTERSYGSFCRTIPLPEGAKPDTASATFENGVLKIEMEAPGGGQSQSRRIEVRETEPH